MEAARSLALWLGVALVVVLLGSCGAGFAVVNYGGGGALAGARNIGLMVLALFYLVQALIWSVVYFALAWAVGLYGPKIPAALRWTAGKVTVVSTQTARISERFVVRPVAATVRRRREISVLAGTLTSGAGEAAAPVRRVGGELSNWSTLQNRLRRGSTPVPVGALEGTAAPPGAGPPGTVQPVAGQPGAGDGDTGRGEAAQG